MFVKRHCNGVCNVVLFAVEVVELHFHIKELSHAMIRFCDEASAHV